MEMEQSSSILEVLLRKIEARNDDLQKRMEVLENLKIALASFSRNELIESLENVSLEVLFESLASDNEYVFVFAVALNIILSYSKWLANLKYDFSSIETKFRQFVEYWVASCWSWIPPNVLRSTMIPFSKDFNTTVNSSEHSS